MKAVVVHKYGGPEVLRFEDYPDPVPGAGEAFVRVAAASVNPLGYKRRAGLTDNYYPIHFPAHPERVEALIVEDAVAHNEGLHKHSPVPGYISPVQHEHASILKFVERIFRLPTLASVNHQFDVQTPGTNNDAANGQALGPPAPPRDG
jgi:hypothetical protein